MTSSRLDSRTWLVWALAGMIPVTIGRNPWVLAEVLMIVMVVRTVWIGQAQHHGMRWFLRIAAVMVLVSVVFNLLTVHAGDRLITELPDRWPLVGGPITWNALVFGMVSGIALFTLVLIGITISALVAWIDLFHALPQRLAPIAVTGSVAWAFLPQTAVAWNQIREAQVMRGHRFRGIRDFVPMVVPLLAGGLERSLTMAEALESRGFGVAAQGSPSIPGHWRKVAFVGTVTAGLVGIAVAAYCLAVGQIGYAAIAAVIGGVDLFSTIRLSPTSAMHRTRYRTSRWTSADVVVIVTSVASISATIAWAVFAPDSLAYRVYPILTVPEVPVGLLLALGLLIVPAMVYDSAAALQ
jgi:energy-coupling factor transport system permease protein